jgi:hypothetical protein
VTIRPASSPYTIVLEDLVGNALATYAFAPRPYQDTPTATAQVAEVVPWVFGTRRITIRRAGLPLPIASRDVSFDPPRVRIIAPNGGETLQGRSPVTWIARDQNRDAMTYTLLYSTDDGGTWQTVAAGIRDKQYVVDFNRLPSSDAARFRVIATDGVNTGIDETNEPFTVPGKAPTVGIESPVDGASFTASQTIVLNGTAADVDQGELDGASLQWASNMQGALGEGRSISVSNLTPGLHTVSLTATDDEGMQTTASIDVEIVDDNLPVLDWNVENVESAPDGPFPDGLFLYDNAEEVGAFYQNSGAGALEHLRTFDVLLNGWSAVVPGNFGGDDYTDLFFYDETLGVGEFFAGDGQGGLQLMSGNEGFTLGWDIIVPGDFDGQGDWTDLFFYDRAEGVGKIYRTDGTGRIELLGAPVPLADRWSTIVAGDFGGDARTDLLFYDKANGLARIDTPDGQGGLEPLLNGADWTAGWDQIVPGNFAGADDVTDFFLYDTETGNATFLTADGSGKFVSLGSLEPLSTPWTTIVSGDFAGNDDLTDLYLYDSESGQGGFYATDGAGGLTAVSEPTDFAGGWDLVVPGRFGSP